MKEKYALPPDTIVFGYEMKRTVGHTPLGIVYEATHELLGTNVRVHELFVPEYMTRDAQSGAVVVRPGQEIGASASLDRFVENARLLCKWMKPGILPVLNALSLEESNLYFCVVPAGMPGANLTSESELQCFIRSALESLIALGKEGYVPQNLTPQNFCCTMDGRWALDPMGNLMPVGQMPAEITPGFAPIEYIQVGSCSPGDSSPLYSLAAVAYYLITGQAPPAADSRIAKTDPYKSLAAQSELVKRFGQHLLSSIDKALALWPEDRWTTAGDWLQLLSVSGFEAEMLFLDINSLPETLEEAVKNNQPAVLKYLISHSKALDKSTWPDLLTEAISSGHKCCVQVLLESGADPNKANSQGWIPLYVAAEKKQSACVELLLKHAAAVDVKCGTQQWTPLYVASREGHADCLKLLLKAGANPDAMTKDGFTSLYSSCGKGHVDCVKLLLEYGATVDVKCGTQQWTPLYVASREGHADCLKLLLKAGANPDAMTKDGFTSLYSSCEKGHVDCVKLLLEYGATVDGKSAEGKYTPLMHAVSKEKLEIIPLLLAAGADLQQTCKEGLKAENFARTNEVKAALKTAPGNPISLVAAVSQGNLQVVKDLLKKGVPPDSKDEVKDRTPLELAVKLNRPDMVRMLRAAGAEIHPLRAKKFIPQGAFDVVQALSEKVTAPTTVLGAAVAGDVETLRRLLDSGAFPDAPRSQVGATPLMRALVFKHTACVDLLLEAGASIYETNYLGVPVLNSAVVGGLTDYVRYMIESGVDVNSAVFKGSPGTPNGQTVLMRAAEYGRKDCIRLLLAAGAEVNAQTEYGKTALMYAAEKNHVECVIVLLAHQANASVKDVFGKRARDYATSNECRKLLPWSLF